MKRKSVCLKSKAHNHTPPDYPFPPQILEAPRLDKESRKSPHPENNLGLTDQL